MPLNTFPFDVNVTGQVLSAWLRPGVIVTLLGLSLIAHSSDNPEIVKKPAAPSVKASTSGSSSAKEMGDQVREALRDKEADKKQLTFFVNGKDNRPPTLTSKESALPAVAPKKATSVPQVEPLKPAAGSLPNPKDSRNYLRARNAATAGHEAHWSYEGATGPQSWSKLKPEFGICATGKRQSPIHIDESATLQGPAEPIRINYQPSNGTVVNNGHTIQVDVVGDNSITVRASTYKLIQFHFHHPSEERVNNASRAMVAHLVHRNSEGQLAIIGVLLDPGPANALINKVWTFMPLDAGDSVRMPAGLIDLNELLPKDPRYYQFMGSLTTPPCTEGVLWMVFKQPVSLSPQQIKLFAQLFPNNARPVQPTNGRAVRDAQ